MNKPCVLFYRSPLGVIRLRAENGALVSAAFVDDAGVDARCPVLSAAKDWLDRYFQGSDPGPIPPCNPQGTAFQKTVWNALLSIPYGETVSYGALAERIGYSSRYARTVGGAVGKNPIALFYPCHRVLGKDGTLTGFAYGPDRKAALLKTENPNL